MTHANDTATDAAATSLSRGLFRAGSAYPWLREPIEGLERIPDAAVTGLATDGARLFYRPGTAIGEEAVEHLLLHCLFRHLLPPEGAIRPLWNLACDISAEYLRTELFPSREGKLTRLQIGDALPEDVDPRIARAVYRALLDLFEDELEPLYARFARDDHRYWYAPARGDSPSAAPGIPARSGREEHTVPGPGGEADYRAWLERTLADRWPSADELSGGANRTGRYGLNPGSREERLLLRREGRYDFSRYLRRFSATREELRLDMGSFDYIPYCYGLERYGNLPLIEPLEYSESHKVEQLVIAIDTSGSCTRPMVERFLAEIERILMRRDSFFRRMDVHIIQCDAMVQSHVEIHSVEAWKRYAKNLVIKGRSGTNFTPVFDLVERLREQGRLRRLKGLIYFTDGEGVYPREKTPYETAFVFIRRKSLELDIPKWIIPLCLEKPWEEGWRGGILLQGEA